MKDLYCISGLGADHRLFAHLAIPGYRLVAVPWVPHTATDDMASYAAKLFKTIPAENPAIAGFSLGGMLATEMCLQNGLTNVLLISSAKTKKELGYDSRILKWLSRSEVIPEPMFGHPFSLGLYLLGARSDEEKALLQQVIRDSSPAFVKHCVDMLLHWQNDTIPAAVKHIHGTADLVIRPDGVYADAWVTDGSHLMIYNRASEVSSQLAAWLPA